MATYLSNKEHFMLSRELEKHHAIFERIWTLSRIRFSGSVPTAGVKFNRRGDCIDFFVNPEFWESLNFIKKCFVLSHECMHIALNHGARRDLTGKSKAKCEQIAIISNIAQDIVINHSLDERYGFYRDDIDPVLPIFDPKTGEPVIDPKTGQQMLSRAYCWTDTVFPENAEMPTDENYEYYYIRLKRKVDEQEDFLKKLMENIQTVDDHTFSQENAEQNQGMPMEIPGLEGMPGMPGEGEGEGEGKGKGEKGEGKGGKGDSEIGDDEWDYFDSEDYSDDFGEIIDKLDRDMSNEDKNTLQKFVEENENSGGDVEENPEYGPDGKTEGNPSGGDGGQGNSAGNKWTFAKRMPIKKRKFEHIITSWAKKRLTVDEVDADQWARVSRRFSSLDSDMILPYEIEMDDDTYEDDKIDVWFYQDTSGSCGPWKDRFFSIAEAMPLEKFNMRMFCFDTNIYETSLESRELKGFGGTHFHILENHLQEELIKNPKMKRYPEAIFVVTDGLGTEIKPEHPSRWHWILTPGGSRDCIPKACNIHDLAKYE